ncbi:MAG: SDR family oxidoreductase [Alphaproteobacteria bacterium]|nr:SDR family oxidoreductase [Alphaproteobacteria bacterium]
MSDDRKIALVTGANRGIGLEICRQLAGRGVRVILTARDQAKGDVAAAALRAQGLDVVARALDVTDERSVQALAHWIKSTYGRLDILINNAGVLLERIYGQDANIETDAMDVDVDLVATIINTNTLGPLRTTQRLAPLMPAGGRIINLASQMGLRSWANSNMVGYRVSKTALMGLTANLAKGLAKKGITVNCMCPGWVKTDMGSRFAQITVDQGADTAIWLALDADAKHSGKFFYKKQELTWDGQNVPA